MKEYDNDNDNDNDNGNKKEVEIEIDHSTYHKIIEMATTFIDVSYLSDVNKLDGVERDLEDEKLMILLDRVILGRKTKHNKVLSIWHDWTDNYETEEERPFPILANREVEHVKTVYQFYLNTIKPMYSIYNTMETNMAKFITKTFTQWTKIAKAQSVMDRLEKKQLEIEGEDGND